MPYSADCIYLNNAKPQLKVNAKFGSLGQAWLDIDLPPDFYDCIFKLVDAKMKEHEQLLRAAILGEEPSKRTIAQQNIIHNAEERN